MKQLIRALPIMIFLLVMTVFVACGDDDDGNTDGTPTPSGSVVVSTSTPFPDQGFQFEIHEVVLGDDGYVVLENYTDQPASLNGLYLCQPPDCVELPDATVEAETVAIIAIGDGDDLENVVVTDADLVLAPENGEVALYAGDNVTDDEQLRSYLEWGSTPHEGTDVAIEAGLWIEGSYAPTAESATRLFRNDEGLWLFE